jgi:amidophosphoribosyltransferase
MCGIVGIASSETVWPELLDSLIHLQHRGQDAAGIVTCDKRFHTIRGKGLVREVFNHQNMENLKGKTGIAHVRYPTHGTKNSDEIQPFWTGTAFGISLAHNGNLTNYESMKALLNRDFKYHLNTESDSELLLYLFARRLSKLYQDVGKSFFDALQEAVLFLFQHLKGAYSVVSNIIGQGLCAFRDPHGIRPLVIGQRQNEKGGKDTIIASETTMFHQMGYERIGDVAPGELVFVDGKGLLHRASLMPSTFKPCIFEYVYFARPDAILNDVSVYRSRLRMGQNLAQLWQERFPTIIPDVVIPVPFTSNTAALSFASHLGVRYTEGLYKNPFIGRTFIMGNKQKRKQSVRHKLSPQETEIRDKDVLLLDDSIVRGTTSKEIVAMVREHGARKVYFASACPVVKHPCYYGINMPTQEELLSFDKTEEEIRQFLNVDEILYQSIPNLEEAVMRKGEHHIERPCMACLDGDYICGKQEQKVK